MKRLCIYALLLAATVFTAGCERTDEGQNITNATITAIGDNDKIKLKDGETNAEFAFKASHSWHIQCDGNGFSVSPMQGSAGNTVLTIEAPQNEPAERTSVLGSFTISIDRSDVKYAVRVIRLPQPPEDGGKTMVAWLFGTSLSYYLNRNLKDMELAMAGNATGGSSLMVFAQMSNTKAEIREMHLNSETGECETVTLETVTLPSDLMTAREFGELLNTTMEYAPANRYSVMFLGHSTAWIPREDDTPSGGETEFYGLRRRYSFSFDKMPEAAVTRTIGEKNVQLNISELAEGLASTGVKFDCLYFDVCFMSSLEAAYELRNTTDFIIGSPCEIMGDGSPYDIILQPLYEGDYDTVCERYFQSYAQDLWYPSGCIAAIDCSKLEALAETVGKINATPVADGFDLANIQAYEGRGTSGRYAGHWFYDAGHYFSDICADEQLVGEFEERLSECIPYRYHTAAFYSAYNNRMNPIGYFSGINLTPDEKCISTMEDSAHRQVLEELNASLHETEWYKATH